MRHHQFFVLSLLALAACGEVSADSPDAAPPPTLTAVSPDHGPLAGGIEVTATGTGLSSPSAIVVVGGVQATDVTVVDDTTVTFTLPPGSQNGEVVDVTVGTQNGFATVPDAIRYNLAPVAFEVTPNFGRSVGGLEITIRGRGFADFEPGTTTVMVGSVAATDVEVVDDETLVATTAENTVDEAFTPLDVTVSNANGATGVENAFTMSAQGILAAARCCTNELFYMNPATGHTAQIGRTLEPIKDCATSSTGTLFTVRRRQVDGQFELATFDATTGAVTPIGLTTLVGVNRNVVGLTFVGTTLIGYSSQIQSFVSVNTTNGTLTQIGVPVALSPPLAMAPRDATTAWLVDRFDESLDFVTVSTGIVTTSVDMTGVTVNAHSAVIIDGDLFVGDRNSPARVFAIDTTTGAIDLAATFPRQVRGMCRTPSTF